MKTKKPVLRPLALVTSVLIWCASNLHAQPAPTITTQPTSQTNLAGANVTFSVAVAGTGPFTYQWQFNGTNLPNNIITTVAGNDYHGLPGYSGDGGMATNASLAFPFGVALDASGNLYIADTDNNRIRRVDTNGIITTLAGNGTNGYSGDGGAATKASLNNPRCVALDAMSNLYISDSLNDRIRKVDTNGIITTVAGSSPGAYYGDGGAATNAGLWLPGGLAFDVAGNLYIADTYDERIRMVNTNGIITTVAGNGTYYFGPLPAGEGLYFGDGGPATNAGLNWPMGVTVDAAGNLYIADHYNQRIRKVDTNGIITTFAGNGVTVYSGPDPNGSGSYSGDDGPATNAGLSNPIGVALDAVGKLYIADTLNSRIREVDTNGIITTVAGGGIGPWTGDGGAATSAFLKYPSGVFMDAAGNIYIADTSNNRIREVHPNGYPILSLNNLNTNNAGDYAVVIGSPYGSVTSAVAVLRVRAPPVILVQPASQGVLPGSNAALSVTAAGDPPLYYSWYFDATNEVQNSTNAALIVSNMNASDVGQYMVIVTNASGSAFSHVATLAMGFAPSVAAQPASQTNLIGTNVTFSVTATGTGPFSYQWQFNGTNIADNIITTVAGNGIGTYAGDGGAATNASLNHPIGVTFDSAGNLYIADFSNSRIRKVDTNGIITTMVGGGSGGDGGAATNASLYNPCGLAFDTVGNLYIADQFDHRIRKVDTNGIITTVAGNGIGTYAGDGGAATSASLYYPSSVILDAYGNLYIADYYNQRIRMVNTKGIITTVAGTGYFSDYFGGYSGDGGVATAANLNFPVGLAFDAVGNYYIADLYNQRVRKVDTDGVISTVAGNGDIIQVGSGPPVEIGTYSGDGGPATNAGLNWPSGVSFDTNGNMFIADQYNNRIRNVNTNGIITTVAGGGSGGDGGAATSAGLNQPSDVAFDALGNLYLADSGNNRIREVHFAGLPTLALPNVSTNNNGDYTVVISSPYGSVTSAVAALTVVLPPSILVQPASQGVLPGGDATLGVTATGTPPLYYSWYLNATNLVQNGMNSSLIVTSMSASNTGQYMVVVTNAYASVTSQVATLAFPPSLLTQPGGLTVLPGTNVSFSVTVDGTGPFTYQWQIHGSNLPNNIITTVAGNGSATYSGDGGVAINASLHNPNGVALDVVGNLYIADSANNRIREVDTNGIITTVAGNGSGEYAGDGGPATSASINAPTGVALDGGGNLYIADRYNYRIREVGTNGIMTTFAGGGSNGLGDGGAATNATLFNPGDVALDAAGNVYIADGNDQRIRMVNANGIITTVAGGGSGGDGGAATNASLYYPQGVVLDAVGNLYIADTDNNRIRKVDTNGIITTVAGGGSGGDGGAATNASLSNPYGVALDTYGDLYIVDSGNQRIRMVGTNGIIATVAGNGSATYAGDGGPATSASLQSPHGVALDASDNLYIADTGNQRIRKAFLDAGFPTLILSKVAAADAGNYTVVVTSPYGSVTSAIATLVVQAPPVITVQPTSQTVLAGSSPIFSVAVAGSGPFEYSWFLASTNLVQSGTNSPLALSDVSTNNAGDYTVVVTNDYGSVTSQVATLMVAFPPSVTNQPASQAVLPGTNVSFSVTVDGTGPFKYEWLLNGTSLLKIITTVAGTGAYGFSGDGGPATNAALAGPNAATVDAFGNIFIADWNNNRVRKVTTNGVITTVAGNGTSVTPVNGRAATNTGVPNPAFAVTDPAGNLYISVNGANRIARVGTNGIIINVVGKGEGFGGDGGPATNAYLFGPFGIAFDAFGNLFIADTSNNRIRKVGTNGIITTVAGRGGAAFSGDGGPATNAALHSPWGVFVDNLGNLFISDTWNNRIREVGTNGIITTIAGNGSAGFSGDGGVATNASLNHPEAVSLDASGNLLIADALNNRIRQIDTYGIMTTLAGGGTNYPGDGGPATSAMLGGPSCVAVDASGNIFIDDNWDNRILELISSGSSPSLVLNNVGATNAGNYTVVITSPYGSVTSAVATLVVQAPPAITLQPRDQTVLAGTSPVFSVVVAGSGPFEYLWYFAGTDLVQIGTNFTLTLPGVFTDDAGNYTVVITNAYGSVTSAVATLTVNIPLTPPQIISSGASFGFLTNQFGFNVSGAFGQTIVVDGSTDLLDWTPLFTNTVVSSPFYFFDPASTNLPWRFYRARLP